MDNFYYVNKLTQQKFLSRFDFIQTSFSSPHNLEFVLPSIDSVEFKRKSVNFDLETKEFLFRLKNSHEKINLWYSGGVDSHFLLTNFIKYDIPLNQLTVCTKLPFDHHSCSKITAEELYTALPYLDKISDYVKRHCVEILLPVAGADHYEKFFSNPNWVNNTNNGSVRTPTDIVNVLPAMPDQEDICQLTGHETPFVVYDNGWKFYFVDHQLLPDITSTIYKPTVYDSLFLESYVNTIVDQLEKILNFEDKFCLGQQSAGSKFFSRLVPEMQHANSTVWAQYPKASLDINDRTNILTKINSESFKSYLDYQSAVLLKPRWFDLYCNRTDWQLMEKNYQMGGVLTKFFDLN